MASPPAGSYVVGTEGYDGQAHFLSQQQQQQFTLQQQSQLQQLQQIQQIQHYQQQQLLQYQQQQVALSLIGLIYIAYFYVFFSLFNIRRGGVMISPEPHPLSASPPSNREIKSSTEDMLSHLLGPNEPQYVHIMFMFVCYSLRCWVCLQEFSIIDTGRRK